LISRPYSRKECSCQLEVCDNDDGPSIQALNDDSQILNYENESKLKTTLSSEFVGCIKSDLVPVVNMSVSSTMDDDDEGLHDETCNVCSEDGAPCRAGLPFFTKKLSSASKADAATECLAFCVSKGMDVSATINNASYCMCGATVANSAIHKQEAKESRKCLVFSQDVLSEGSEKDAAECSAPVFRYTGPLEDGGMPGDLMKSRLQDHQYVDSMVAGERIRIEEDFDEEEEEEDEVKHDDIMASENVSAASGNYRRCYPYNCADGSGPFGDNWKSSAPTANKNYHWYSWVYYTFDWDVDNVRRQVFRQAAKYFLDWTCLVVAETTDKSKANFRVGIYNRKSCYASNIGRNTKDSKINLGWCNKQKHFGSMVHEIGHMLGMAHEQKRMDAVYRYNGHGPHLRINWDQLGGSEWIPQWKPSQKAYMGSAYDGSLDKHWGYAAYDFSSIMHYGVTPKEGSTIPSSSRSLTGNRQSFSWGDVYQLRDMYQCPAIE